MQNPRLVLLVRGYQGKLTSQPSRKATTLIGFKSCSAFKRKGGCGASSSEFLSSRLASNLRELLVLVERNVGAEKHVALLPEQDLPAEFEVFEDGLGQCRVDAARRQRRCRRR